MYACMHVDGWVDGWIDGLMVQWMGVIYVRISARMFACMYLYL